MIIKEIKDEDFINYKLPSMIVAFPKCSFKCGKNYCQNSSLHTCKDISISTVDIVDRYMRNPITKAIVCAGLEPFDSWNDLKDLITVFRSKSNDDIVIYSGYNIEEINPEYLDFLKNHSPIILKIGRYIPSLPSVYDNNLGITLASNNQYSIKV